VEALLLRILEKQIPVSTFDLPQRDAQIASLKAAFSSMLNGSTDIEYYQKHLTLAKLEKLRISIPELYLLIGAITP
jgi:hypothetical protein